MTTKRQVVKKFADDREMAQWLAANGPEALKVEYPPEKYSAKLDMVDREVWVEAK